MVTFKELHKDLFEGASMTIGYIHKYFVIAENIYKKQRKYEPRNIYRWWIKDREKNIDELEEKTSYILSLLDELREQMEMLKKGLTFKTYEDLIQKLNTFIEDRSLTINELLFYVEFLNAKDELVLNMLYDSDIWRSDKKDVVSKNYDDIPQNDPNFDEYCVEFAIGVRDGYGITVYDEVRFDIWDEYYSAVDPEFASQRRLPDLSDRIINRTGWEIIRKCSLFFSNIRKCMRRILERIDEYWNEEYPEVVLEKQIKKIKDVICNKIKDQLRIKKQFNAVLDNLLTIYGSHQEIPLFKTGEDIDEEDFHNEVFRRLYSNLGSKVENHKKVAKGDIDFLVYNYPVDVKVEDKEQELDKIYEAHKDQVAYYCYNRKEDVGFLFVYDNTEKTKDYSTKDFGVFEEKEYKIVVILLRGNFPYPSVIKQKNKGHNYESSIYIRCGSFCSRWSPVRK